MVSRRIFFKSLGLFSGIAAVGSFPVAAFAAQRPNGSSIKWSQRKQGVVIVGESPQSAELMEYALQNPMEMEIVGIIGNNSTISTPSTKRFNDLNAFLQSGIPASVIYLTNQENNKSLALQVVQAGFHVWCDRPFSFSHTECKKINAVASGTFCKAQIVYVIQGQLCFMENKTYSIEG